MYSPPARLDRRMPTRRSVLQGLAAAFAAAIVSPETASASVPVPREVAFVHTHTHERLSVTYFAGGAYDEESLAALNWFLRDHRTGDQHPIDPALFDILHELRLATGAASPYQVISGYRSPRTNSMLRERSSGVASGSLHLQGRAIDVRLSDVSTAALRDAAIRLGRGGVGYYASSDFVHIDTGRVRRW
jgi:uncharacterized protein YcbK (DUF882 family)